MLHFSPNHPPAPNRPLRLPLGGFKESEYLVYAPHPLPAAVGDARRSASI